MATQLLPSRPERSTEASALKSLLERAVPYEKAGWIMPRPVVALGMIGSGVMIGSGLLAIIFPSPQSVSHGAFFLLFASEAAGLESFMRIVALPAIVAGLGLLALNFYLMKARTGAPGRYVVAGQAVAGSVGGVISGLFLALVVLNLVIWIVLCILGVAAVIFVTVAFLSSL